MKIRIKRGILLLLLVVDITFLGRYFQSYQEDVSGKGECAEYFIAVDADGDVIEASGKKIALTFDDGPHPYYTEQLLDGLKERNVKVTFFVTGEHAQLHPDVIERIWEEGHLIGNHTYSHIQLKSDNRDAYKEELQKTKEVLEGIIDEEIVYVRPPYGTWDKTLETELDMIPVLWTIDTLDWCNKDASGVAHKVVHSVEENDIILMHDYYDTTVTAALAIVDALQKEGYVFVTVEEILFD